MGSGKIDLTQFAGLVTAPGLLQRNEASCLVANNWEFPAPGIVRKRRGSKKLLGNTGGPTWKLLTSRLLGNKVIAHVGTGTLATQFRVGDGVSVALTALNRIDGSQSQRNADVRTQGAVCQRNHYATGHDGVVRIESDLGALGLPAVRMAGMPRGMGLHADLPTGGVQVLPVAGGVFASGEARAYRITWHRKDADGIELGGAPTARFVATNAAYNSGFTGGAANFALTIQVPLEVGTVATDLNGSYYFRLWGAAKYVEATQAGSDDMHLLQERYVTGGEIAAGILSVTDSTPDDFLLGSPRLHTNIYDFPPSEANNAQGVVNEDAPPPQANDIAYWQDVMWFSDVQHNATLSMVMTALPANGDQIVVQAPSGFTTFTFKTVPAVSNDVLIQTGSTTAINIRDTAYRLVAAMNAALRTDGFVAYHVATSDTQPGVIMAEMRNAASDPLQITPLVSGKWQGLNGYDLQTAVHPTTNPNQLYYSKPLRADAVPPINVLSVGPNDSRILRIFPFRDRLLVFTDYGIFNVVGRSYADFSVAPFDLGFRLLGRDLVAMCDQKVYAWCYEGIVEIDDGGVQVISAPIEPTIEAAMVSAGGASFLTGGRTVFGKLGFAVAYRNQHQVRFHYPQADDSVNLNGCHYWLSFDTRTRAWATGEFPLGTFSGYLDSRSCGAVRFGDDLLVHGNWSSGVDTWLYLERRDYVGGDFLDESPDGTKNPLVSTLRMQFQVPDSAGAQHWQQCVVNWDQGEISWRALPTTVQFTFRNESGSSVDTESVTAQATRSEPASGVRRAQRMSVEIQHTGPGGGEYAGIIGISMAYRSGSRYARNVTP